MGSDEEGEIVIRGPNVTAGYAGNEEANAQSFSAGWFRTGDRGRMDGEGYLYITGRLKEMVNRGGENIAPREVDEVLLEHPAVAQAIAFAVPHPTLGEDLAAAVVVKRDAKVSEQSLRDYAFDRLADFKVPSQVIFVDAIPKGPTGKQQRIGLADKLAAKLQAPFVAPRNRVEETLAKFWAKTLRLKKVSIHDNFFAMGGDSLQAHELFAQIEHSLGKKLPPTTLFHSPTIEQLAGTVSNGQCTTSQNALVPIQSGGSKPPLFFVHAHEGSVIDERGAGIFAEPFPKKKHRTNGSRRGGGPLASFVTLPGSLRSAALIHRTPAVMTQSVVHAKPYSTLHIALSPVIGAAAFRTGDYEERIITPGIKGRKKWKD